MPAPFRRLSASGWIDRETHDRRRSPRLQRSTRRDVDLHPDHRLGQDQPKTGRATSPTIWTQRREVREEPLPSIPGCEYPSSREPLFRSDNAPAQLGFQAHSRIAVRGLCAGSRRFLPLFPRGFRVRLIVGPSASLDVTTDRIELRLGQSFDSHELPSSLDHPDHFIQFYLKSRTIAVLRIL